jgi:hypothetical protein
MAVDEHTPIPRPRTWPDVVLQLGQTLVTAGATLLLARWGMISGEIAAGALGIAVVPAVMRLAGRRAH